MADLNENMVCKIGFHGLSCFSIETGDILLIFDPHDGVSLGLGLLSIRDADVVLCSHSHYDHSNGKHLVSKAETFLLEEKPGDFNFQGIKIHGTKVRHGDWPHWGHNIVYSVEFPNNLGLIHVGDMGYLPTDEELKEILIYGQPDVAILPIGGKYSLDADSAIKTAELLNPKYTTIVCHYLYGALLDKEDFVGMTDEKPFLSQKANETEIINENFIDLPANLSKFTLFSTSQSKQNQL